MITALLAVTSTKAQQNSRSICPHADQSLIKPTEESLSGSNSSEREGPAPGGPTVSGILELEHNNLCTEVNATSPFHVHKGLEEQPVVVAPENTRLMSRTAKLEVEGDNMLLQCANPLSDSACYQQQDSQQESLGRCTRKSLSDSELVIQFSKNNHEESDIVMCVASKHQSVVGMTNEDKDYNHEDRFNSAEEEREGAKAQLEPHCRKEFEPSCEEWEAAGDDKEGSLAEVPNHAPEVSDNKYPGWGQEKQMSSFSGFLSMLADGDSHQWFHCQQMAKSRLAVVDEWTY